MKRKERETLGWLLLLFLLEGTLCVAQEPETELTLESMTREVRVSQVAFSSDGKQIAFVSNKSGVNKVYLIPATGGEPQMLVPGREPENFPRWSPDGKRIAFLSSRGGQPDIWVVSAAGGEPTRVSNDKESEQGIAWSRDGRRIAYVSRRDQSMDVFVVDAGGGAPRRVTQDANAWDEVRWAPCWSPDGLQIALVSSKSEYYADDLWLFHTDGSGARKLTAELQVMTDPVWSPDGRFLAYNAVKKSEFWYGDMTDIYLTEMPSRKTRRVPLNTFVSDLNGALHMYWGPDSKTLYFRYQYRGNWNIWAVDATGDGVATQITNGAGTIPDMDVSPKGDRIAFIRATQLSPGELFVIPTLGGQPVQLTRWATRYRGLVPPVEISFRSTDGKYIHGYLYQPPKREPGKKYPGLVQVHGGGNNANGNGFHALEHYLSHQDFVVLAIEYRGSASYGREFQLLSYGDWAAGQGWDAVAASDFLRSLDDVNGKVGIYGGSYGGIMSMAAITRDSSKFQAGAPFYGIFDWAAAYQDADRLGKFWVVMGHMGYKPGENPELYDKTATIKHLENVTTPLLIIHGELDRRAPFRQSVRLVEELKKLGKVVEFYHYPGEYHGFRLPANRVDAYSKMEAWFNKYLR